MYSIIEGIYKAKKARFNIVDLEKKYPNFRELRLFNNKLKHHENRDYDIVLTKLTMSETSGRRMDYYLQFYNLETHELVVPIRFADLIDVFLKILEYENIITIERIPDIK